MRSDPERRNPADEDAGDTEEKPSRLTGAGLALAWLGMMAPFLLQLVLRSGHLIVSVGVIRLAVEISYWASWAALTLAGYLVWKRRPGIFSSVTIVVALLGIYTYLTAQVSVHHHYGGG